MTFELLVLFGIGGLMLTAILHSIGGEAYLLRPLFKKRGNRVLESALSRLVLRSAWHVTSMTWLVLAIILYAYAFKPDDLGAVILLSIGSCFAGIGLFDLIATRGRHAGWPFLLLTGLAVLSAYFYR